MEVKGYGKFIDSEGPVKKMAPFLHGLKCFGFFFSGLQIRQATFEAGHETVGHRRHRSLPTSGSTP